MKSLNRDELKSYVEDCLKITNIIDYYEFIFNQIYENSYKSLLEHTPRELFKKYVRKLYIINDSNVETVVDKLYYFLHPEKDWKDELIKEEEEIISLLKEQEVK